MDFNKLLGMIGTTVGGGLVGAGIQRTYMFGNKFSSAMSKAFGKTQFKFDSTTWAFLIIGVIVIAAGVYFLTKKK